jgi:hypothetical protein
MERKKTLPLIDIIRSKLPGVPKAELEEVIAEAYSILMTNRTQDWEIKLKGLHETNEEQLVKAMLDQPAGFGIERKAVHTFTDYVPSVFDLPDDPRGESIVGQVFRREGKPYSADFSGNINVNKIERNFVCHPFEQHGQPLEVRGAEFNLDIMIVGDGATMMVDKAHWPTEVVKRCSFNLEGGTGTATLPDVFWRTATEHILGLQTSASPFTKYLEKVMGPRNLWASKIDRLVRDKFQVYQEPTVISDLVWKYVNQNLVELYREVFKGFSIDNAPFYPSGVFGVVVMRRISQGYPNANLSVSGECRFMNDLGGFTSSGDISIVDGDSLKRYTDIDLVNRHDALLDSLLSRPENPEIVAKVANIRKNLVGNTPNPKANYVTGSIEDRTSQILMYTDGLYLDVNKNNSSRFNRISVYKSDGADFTTHMILRDPELAVISRRRQNRFSGVRGDDGAYAYWGNLLQLKYLAPNL